MHTKTFEIFPCLIFKANIPTNLFPPEEEFPALKIFKNSVHITATYGYKYTLRNPVLK